ncbi:LLM class flavin-dependent oxidoreductase [Amycolatopsis sp.]|uniref:LLM class flavin-dependent oxidoreductase n=1 Tax=Amycolatopsis sp. TaxID=37632 RepID=UPI002D14D9C6|nr:LLM class flavin-dependent oxidoreductase [Amycolatopsis sp.]HVV08295.1 LLM class flavin-dependent oxidoreductase [Amycolatopsis sp.]
MRIDTNILGAVRMPDAGADGPPATSRRYGRGDYATAYRDFVALSTVADEVGFDTFWYTEHHFQHEGYEVVPNQILLGLYCAAVTKRISFGQMFNIVPQWNPLRLAEDFAAADVLTGGRMRFGVGRGTVPREMQTLGARIESGDNAMDAAAEQANRERFAEAMAAIRLAFGQDRFAHHGKHFAFPPEGIPDRGGFVSGLTLVPNVTREVEIYQACTSPRTMDYVAEHGHIGVYTRQSPRRLAEAWQKHAELTGEHGRPTEVGEEQMLVLHVNVAPTHEEAVALARPGHDELAKLLAPYGRFATYDPPEGMDATPFDYAPTLEESMRQRIYLVGDFDEVAGQLAGYRELLGLRRLSVSMDALGLTPQQHQDQLRMFAAEVAPRLGIEMSGDGQRTLEAAA